MSNTTLTLELFKNKYGVCRLDVNETIPSFAQKSEFFSITKTHDELSVVCLEKDIPSDVLWERDWRIFKIQGVLDFSLIGILAEISSVLAENKISIFAISTYDTDYILVKDKDVSSASKVLLNNGYKVLD